MSHNHDLNLLFSVFLRVFKRVVCTWGDITWRRNDEMFSLTIGPL